MLFQLTKGEEKHLRRNDEKAETIQIKLRILDLDVEDVIKKELLNKYRYHLDRAIDLRIRFRRESRRDTAVAAFLSIAPVINTLIGLSALIITFFAPTFSLPEAVPVAIMTFVSIVQFLMKRFFQVYQSHKRYKLYSRRSKLFEQEFLRYLDHVGPYEGNHADTYSQFVANFLKIKEQSDQEISEAQEASVGEEPIIDNMEQAKLPEKGA
jgi:hypothetical protein